MAEVDRPRKAVSDRRRQQNRKAQKNYRERQMRRLRALEAVLETHEISTGPSLVLNGLEAVCDSGFRSPLCSHEDDSQTTRRVTQRLRSDEPRLSHPPDMGSEAALVQNSSSGLVSSTAPLTCSATNNWIDLDSTISDSAIFDTAPRNNTLPGDITIRDVLIAGLKALSNSSPLPTTMLGAITPSTFSTSVQSPPVLRTDQILVLVDRRQEHTYALPDPKANHLRITRLSSVAALRQNAEMLGVSFARLCTEDAISPFYSTARTVGGSKGASLAQFQHLSPDLRPTPSQVRHRHHPWIDAVPSPTLRQRLVECISADPPIVDEEDFCDDLENDGLICWGSTANGSKLPHGSGAPWDVRSWEAQPWFLKKWWFVLGGSNGELFQASRWWTEMRGDRLEVAWS